MFWFSLFMPAAILDHADSPIFQNYLRVYVNEYGHFEKLQIKKKEMNVIIQISR